MSEMHGARRVRLSRNHITHCENEEKNPANVLKW